MTGVRMRAKHLLGALAVAAALLAVGTTVHGVSAQAAVQRAARASLDAGTFRFSMALEPSGLPGPAEAFAARGRIEGVMDSRRHRGTFSAGGRLSVIYDGDVTYINLGPLTARFGLAKQWVSAEGGQRQSLSLDPREGALRDPSALLLFLRRASDDVREVGRERLDGVETVHYAGTLDLALVAKNAPAEEREALESELELLEELGMSARLPYDVWVDASDVTRRLRFVQGEAGASWTTTIDFFDFGVPVELPIPSPDELLSDEELAAAMHTNLGEDIGDCDGETCSQVLVLAPAKGGGK